MNEKEEFVDYLTKSTYEGGMSWKEIVSDGSLLKYITNADRISTVFVSNDGDGNKMFFVTQKDMRVIRKLDQYYEQFIRRILVIDSNKELVYNVNEYEVSLGMLDDLYNAIIAKKGSSFIKNFMHSKKIG